MDHQGEDYSGSRIIVQGQKDHILSNTPLSPQKHLSHMCHPKEAWTGLSGIHWAKAQSPKSVITDSSYCAP